MSITPAKALRTAVGAFKSTLEASAIDRHDATVSTHLAEHYNTLLDKAAAFAELKEHLPPRITSNSPFSHMGVSDATYTDLKVYLNQLADLLDLLEAEPGEGGDAGAGDVAEPGPARPRRPTKKRK